MTELEVSVPFRGFRGLQVYVRDYAIACQELFQSPSGVLGVCRALELGDIWFKATGFQSPSGVLGVCRSHRSSRHTPSPRFSPLPGF